MQSANGLALQAVTGSDYCQVTINFPSDTIPKWVCSFFVHLFSFLSQSLMRARGVFLCNQKDPKTGELEGLSFEFNLCEAVATWQQVSFVFLCGSCAVI